MSYHKINDGATLPLPAKEDVAAAIAAVRSRSARRGISLNSPGNSITSPLSTPGGQRQQACNNLHGPHSARSAGVGPATATAFSLFQHSNAKLQSFSFSESTDTEGTGMNNITGPLSHNATHYAVSPSMAQLRARKLINESRNNKNGTISAIGLSHTDSDADTDMSSVNNVDPSTMAEIGKFIDSLQKKKQSNNNAKYVNVMTKPPILNVATGLDAAKKNTGGSPSSNAPTPRRGNVIKVNTPKISLPHFADDDSDDSSTLNSDNDTDEGMHNKNVTTSLDQTDKQHELENDAKPETEEEIDKFVACMNTARNDKRLSVSTNSEVLEKDVADTVTYNGAPTIADELNAMSYMDNSLVPKNQVIEANNASAPTKFSFYTPEALVPMQDPSVQSAMTYPEKSEIAPAQTPRDPNKLLSPASSIGKSSVSASRISAGKSITPVSRVATTPASSVGKSKDLTSPASKTELSTGSCISEGPSQTGHNADPSYDESLAFISSQIKQVVRSEVPLTTLGKVLTEANRRGIKLDVVTELYKKERLEFSSEKIVSWEAKNAGIIQENGRVDSIHSKEVQSGTLRDICVASSPRHVTKVELSSPVSSKAQSKPVTKQEVESSRNSSNTKSQSFKDLNRKLAVEEHQSPKNNDSSAKKQQSPKNNHSISPSVHASSLKMKPKEQPQKLIEVKESDKPLPIESPLKSPSLSSKTSDDKTSCYDDTANSRSPLSEVSPVRHKILSPRSMLDDFVVKIKEAVRSSNPSEELGKILAEAKMHHIPINPLVELYTKERMGPTSVPDDINLDQTNTEESDVTDVDVKDIVDGADSFSDRGLSDAQLLQLQHLINHSGETEAEEDIDIESAKEQHLKDIDAFFSRFDIDGIQPAQEDESNQQQTIKKSIEKGDKIATSPKTLRDMKHKCDDSKCESKPSQIIFQDDSTHLELQDSSKFNKRGNIAEVIQNGKETVLYMQESSLEVEFVEPAVLSEISATKKKKKKKQAKEKKKNKAIKIPPRDNRKVVVLRDDLPGYTGYWRSPWERNRSCSHYYSGNCSKDTIDGVAAAAQFAYRSGNARQRHCFLPEKERTKDHKGYSEIDFYSLYEATAVKAQDLDIDFVSWDCREVRQRFLYEKSVESRNWFGMFFI
eukprot:scaffold2066_cov68-Cyclotella_meneghiniana.AAC.11